MRRFGKRTTVISVALSVLLVAGVAFAAWTSSGDGSGTAQSTTSVDSVITPEDFAADLYPGALKDITVTIDNDNDYPVEVTSISAGSSDALTAPACAAGSVLTAARSAAGGLTQEDGTTTQIAAGGEGTYVLESRMIGDANEGCKSRTFNMDLTAVVVSDATTAP